MREPVVLCLRPLKSGAIAQHVVWTRAGVDGRRALEFLERGVELEPLGNVLRALGADAVVKKAAREASACAAFSA